MSASASLTVTTDSSANTGTDVQARKSSVRFGDIISWHKTVTEYELGHVHPQLAIAEQVAPALRGAVRRGQMIPRNNYEDACRAIAAASGE